MIHVLLESNNPLRNTIAIFRYLGILSVSAEMKHRKLEQHNPPFTDFTSTVIFHYRRTIRIVFVLEEQSGQDKELLAQQAITGQIRV